MNNKPTPQPLPILPLMVRSVSHNNMQDHTRLAYPRCVGFLQFERSSQVLKDFYCHHARQHREWVFKETVFWMWVASQNQPCPAFSNAQLLLWASQNGNASISLHDQGCYCSRIWLNFCYCEPYRLEPVSSPPWHIQGRCAPVFCYSPDVSVVMISDVTSTGMCIIKCIQTEEQSRGGQIDWLNFLKNYSLESGLFNLDCKEQTLMLACLSFISTLGLLIMW